MTTFWLCISMLCCDDTLRSLFATCTSCGLVRVVGRSRLKTIQLLVFCSSKRLIFERMVVLFKGFFLWWVKRYGNSTKRNWNVCCTRLLRLVLRTILLAHKAVFKLSIFLKGSLWCTRNILVSKKYIKVYAATRWTVRHVTRAHS